MDSFNGSVEVRVCLREEDIPLTFRACLPAGTDIREMVASYLDCVTSGLFSDDRLERAESQVETVTRKGGTSSAS